MVLYGNARDERAREDVYSMSVKVSMHSGLDISTDKEADLNLNNKT